MNRRTYIFQLTILFLLFGISSPVLAQFNMGGGGSAKRDTSVDKLKITGFPFIQYDRTQDLIFGAMGMAMFHTNKEDTVSPTSMAGLAVLGTQRESWGAIGFSQLYLKEDSWRLTFAAGYFSYNYQFYWDVIPNHGQFIQYNSGYIFGYGRVMRRVSKRILVGTHFTYMKANTTLFIQDQNVVRPVTYLNNTGLDLDYDSRDNVYYPGKGFLIESAWDWAPEWIGNTQSFNKIELSANNYQRINRWWVQASRFHTAFGLGEVPFEAQEILGSTDIRGYSQGKQRGDQLYALQTESRFQILNRWYLVAFGGVGTTISQSSDISWDNLWPGGGGGFRFTVIPSENMNIGLDAAAGRDDWSLSFTFGESF